MRRLSPLLLALTSALAGCAASPAFDPVTMDAPRGEPPAESPELQFVSAGAHLNAYAHIAAGPGPHPTAVLLHGFPGNERNLDLAQALRRAGWNALYFTYRGAWGSGGEFSFGNALEDVAAVVATLREPAFARRYRVDAQRIVLVGHSMGGAAALVSAAKLDAVKCVASLAGANFAALGERASASPEAAKQTAALFQSWGEGRIRDISGAAMLEDLVAHRVEYAATSHAEALARKPVLLVAGARDDVTPPAQHHAPLVAAIRAQGGAQLREVELGSDHAFSDARIALARTVLDWAQRECLPRLAGD
ncbi:MAG: alpha/beta fold hydrolase [Deltaproteobacteria bacterium]|nr:alpha/beta fold hydrolase [Deltaproteobacteria bacterium]